MSVNVYGNQLLVEFLFITIATVTANLVCNRTIPSGTDVTFYNAKDLTTVVIDNYLSISCCAENFEDIVWYKDELSSETLIDQGHRPVQCGKGCLRQYHYELEEDGQVLFVRKSRKVHEGLYICKIRNGSIVRELQQEVRIVSRENDALCDVHVKQDACQLYVETYVGDTTTICCTFTQLTRQDVNIRWETRTNSPIELETVGIVKMSYTSFHTNVSAIELDKTNTFFKESTLTLRLSNITTGAFGTYISTASSRTNKCHANCTILIYSKATMSLMIEVEVIVGMVISFTLGSGIMIIISAVYIWSKYQMTLWLFVSDLLPVNDNMEARYDAYISHSDTDDDRIFAVQVLRPLLESNNYSTCIDGINFPVGGIRFDDGIAAVNGSRRCILILSPDYINNVHCRFELYAALDDMKQLKGRCLKIVPIIFKDCSQKEFNNSKQLQRVLVAISMLKWTPEKAESFEKKLLNRMPKALEPVKCQHSRPKEHNEVNDKVKQTVLSTRFYNPPKIIYQDSQSHSCDSNVVMM